MRKDLNKLLCERERSHSKEKFKHHRERIEYRFFRDPEVAPNHLSRSQIYGNKHSFNENLSPLYNFLRGAVNRKWDDVYSEISSVFKKNSVINQQIPAYLGYC